MSSNKPAAWWVNVYTCYQNPRFYSWNSISALYRFPGPQNMPPNSYNTSILQLWPNAKLILGVTHHPKIPKYAQQPWTLRWQAGHNPKRVACLATKSRSGSASFYWYIFENILSISFQLFSKLRNQISQHTNTLVGTKYQSDDYILSETVYIPSHHLTFNIIFVTPWIPRTQYFSFEKVSTVRQEYMSTTSAL